MGSTDTGNLWDRILNFGTEAAKAVTSVSSNSDVSATQAKAVENQTRSQATSGVSTQTLVLIGLGVAALGFGVVMLRK